jgi:NAD(P)H-dependent FMN reductase
MSHASPILVIAGSVRPRRVAIKIADWVAALGRETMPCDFEVVDLKAWPLPMDGEPDMPQTGRYALETTRAWARKIAAAPAFVFVSPQYNGGYPAALKNAIDHVHQEWSGKPAMIVTYGGRGGGNCAEQLQQVLQFVKAAPVATKTGLILSRERIAANLGEVDAAAEFVAHLDDLRQAFGELEAALGVVA